MDPITIACLCPSKADGEPRHDTDTITLRERLDFRAVTTIRKAIDIMRMQDPGTGPAEILAAMTEQYLLSGVEAWSLVDGKGKPVEVSRPAIRERLLTDFEAAALVADAADELYAATVLLPLMVRAQASSLPSPTDESISAGTASGSDNPTEAEIGSTPTRPPRPSRRSSTTTSRTGATGTITRLPVGDSSSSPSLASAR